MTQLYKILSISVISVICASKMFAQSDSILCEMPDTTFNNTIKDTIVLEYSKGYVRFETIRREGDKYFAVTSDNKDVEITSMINGKTRALVKDGDGHELVIDKDGNVMGVEEYKKCGGSSKLLSEHNAYRDSTMATSGNVKFSKIKDETYGFDEWRGAEYDKDVYDNFNGYRPTYIGAQKQSNIKVKASQTKGIRFITERGVPIIANTADNTLNLTIGTAGKQTVYVYRDSTLVGKLCIQAYDTKEVKVHVVRVNNAKMPSADKLQSELNGIFSQAVVKLTLDELEPITIKLDHKFKHGGTRRLRAYNDDQRKVVDELKNRAEYNADDFYLFFVDDIERLDDEGNPTSDIIGGYMPVGWHLGFIYNNPKIAYVAHELGHGTLALHHTFADETETFNAPKETTDNLMDYSGGTLLNHKQWQWAHEKHTREWFEEESEGEIAVQIAQCLTAAAIDVAANYAFKWVELWYDGTPADITDYETIFGAMNTAEVITSAGIACATSVIPFPTNKAKLISALTGAFGTGAVALAGDIESQYNSISLQYPDKNVGDILSLVDWGRSLKSAGVQALVGGVISGVSTYAATHPKFVNFVTKLKNLGYDALKSRLTKAGLSDEVAENFCKKVGVTEKVKSISTPRDIFNRLAKTIIKGNSVVKSQREILEEITERKIVNPYNFAFEIKDIVLSEDAYFIRVHGEKNQVGRWLVSIEDFKGFSSIDEYISKTALPIINDDGLVVKPNKVSLVRVPQGTTIRQSVARPQDWPGQGHVAGGATQYEIRDVLYKEMESFFEDLGEIVNYIK